MLDGRNVDACNVPPSENCKPKMSLFKNIIYPFCPFVYNLFKPYFTYSFDHNSTISTLYMYTYRNEASYVCQPTPAYMCGSQVQPRIVYVMPVTKLPVKKSNKYESQEHFTSQRVNFTPQKDPCRDHLDLACHIIGLKVPG